MYWTSSVCVEWLRICWQTFGRHCQEVKYGLMENNDNIVTSFLFLMERLTSRVRLWNEWRWTKDVKQRTRQRTFREKSRTCNIEDRLCLSNKEIDKEQGMLQRKEYVHLRGQTSPPKAADASVLDGGVAGVVVLLHRQPLPSVWVVLPRNLPYPTTPNIAISFVTSQPSYIMINLKSLLFKLFYSSTPLPLGCNCDQPFLFLPWHHLQTTS